MRCADFKIGKIYYAEIKPKGTSSPLLNIFRRETTRFQFKFRNLHKCLLAPGDERSQVYLCNGILRCSPIASTRNVLWETIPVWEIIKAHEISIADLPLYINWPFKSPLYSELLKRGLPNETPV